MVDHFEAGRDELYLDMDRLLPWSFRIFHRSVHSHRSYGALCSGECRLPVGPVDRHTSFYAGVFRFRLDLVHAHLVQYRIQFH